MSTNITKKPFYKSKAFIILVTLTIIFLIFAIAFTALLAIRHAEYTAVIKAFNAELIKHTVNQTFTVTYNGKLLQYWTTEIAAASNSLSTFVWGGKTWYLTTTFYSNDFIHGDGVTTPTLIPEFHLEVWVYMSKPIFGVVHNDGVRPIPPMNGGDPFPQANNSLVEMDLPGHENVNMSFLGYVTEGGYQLNVLFYWLAPLTWLAACICWVPIIIMGVSYAKRKKIEKEAQEKELSLSNNTIEQINTAH